LDPITIGLLASTAVRALSGFFEDTASKTSDELSTAAASGAVAAVRRLAGRVKAKFVSDADASTFERFAGNPTDPETSDIIQRKLKEHLLADEAFASEVHSDLKQVAETNADVAFVNNIQGDVQKLVQIRTVHGDVNF
jgi:hypothetical protein